MYTLYSIPGSCSTGITVLMEKLKLDFETIKREDVPDYTALVPTNQVPALKTPSGQLITEGAAIALYLLEQYDADFKAKSAEEKADFNQWMMFNYATLHPAYSKIFAVKWNSEESDQQAAIIKMLAQKASDTFAILDKKLEGQDFVMGDTPTIIDYLAVIYTSWGAYMPGVEVVLGENVKALVGRVSELPEFKAAYAREGIEFGA